MRDNKATRSVVDGTDVTGDFERWFAGVERELACTEFAFGCGRHPQPVAWAVNSLLNESTHGAHVGIGMGRDMPHIDFIAAGARPA